MLATWRLDFTPCALNSRGTRPEVTNLYRGPLFGDFSTSDALSYSQRRRVKVDGQEARIQCAPVDCYIFSCNVYLALPFFFDYKLDGTRLLTALEKIAQKYPCICGRVVSDSQSRYAIQVSSVSEECNGFPFTEARADLSVAEAILRHSKMKEESPEFPCSPTLPFFMEAIQLTDAMKGYAPLMKVKLTHLKDGCVVYLAIAHILVDGQRAGEVFRDIGRAYCGHEIPNRDHDRSYQWPDRLVEYFPFLGDEVTGLPRTCMDRQQMVGFPENYDQPIETEVLVFSKELLAKMQNHVRPYLHPGEYVSRNDLILALLWMLFAEMSTEKRPIETAADLPVCNIRAMNVVESLMSEINLVPSNYCGTASHGLPLPQGDSNLSSKSFSGLLASLALLSRKTLNEFRQQPDAQAEAFLGYYRLLNSAEVRNDESMPHVKVTNLSKTAVRQVDFGQGKAVLAHITMPLPLYGTAFTAGPGPRNDESVLVYCQFTRDELETLKRSVVIQNCAPGLKCFYSDFTLGQMEKFLGMT